MNAIKDHRCPGLQHIPYSSFCRVCWYPVYSLWIDREDHQGACMFGCGSALNCPDAIGRAKTSARLSAVMRSAPNDQVKP